MDALPPLATPRLWLRPLAAEHADDLHEARGDPECMRHWFDGPSPSIDHTREEVARMATWGTSWAFGRRESGEALGYVGFHGLETGAQVGFGYFVRRSEWGDGVTPEAARAALSYGFDDVGVAHAEFWIDPDNAQSVRVAQKLGAALKSWAPLGQRGVTAMSLIYGLTAAEWRGQLEPPPVLNVVAVLGVSDLERAKRLWCDGLGFRLAWQVDEPMPRAQVLCEWTGGSGVRLVDRAPEAVTPSVVSLHVGGDVEATVDRAASCGWTVIDSPAMQPWGTVDAELRDPDGNRLFLAGVASNAGSVVAR